MIFPATIFSFLTFASTLGWYLCIASTYAVVFQSPPYNMSTGVSGLINIPATIGALIGAYCGRLTDLYGERQARKNDGVFEPETRLVALVVPFFVVPAGLLMYGLGIQHETSWAVPFIGLGFLSFGLAAIPTITMTYGASLSSRLI